jgi:hypothetical protein
LLNALSSTLASSRPSDVSQERTQSILSNHSLKNPFRVRRTKAKSTTKETQSPLGEIQLGGFRKCLRKFRCSAKDESKFESRDVSDIPSPPTKLENKYAPRTLLLTNRCVTHSGLLSPAVHQLVAKLDELSSRCMAVLRQLLADPNVAYNKEKSTLAWSLTESIGDLDSSLDGTLHWAWDPYYPRFVEQPCLGMSSDV